MTINNINIKLFEKQVEKFKGGVKKELNKRRKKFAIAILKNLVRSSPFLTGTYITSHKVGIGSVDYSFSLSPHKAQSREAAELQAIRDGAAKINAAGIFDTIYITNSVPHATDVELLGWKTMPPYHTYGLTYEHMRHRVGKYMGK